MMTEVRGVVGVLRESHHRIAQMMAMGWTDSQIRRVTGITPRRLALYRGDPAMQEIVAKYSKRAEEKLSEEEDFYNSLMSANRLKGELIIADALDEHLDGEREISLSVVDRIVQGRADRTGYGKTSKVEHKHDFAMRLDNAIQRSDVKLIEGQVSETASPSGAVTPALESPDASRAREQQTATLSAPEPTSFSKVIGSFKRRRLA